jgi:hypothetical protein
MLLGLGQYCKDTRTLIIFLIRFLLIYRNDAIPIDELLILASNQATSDQVDSMQMARIVDGIRKQVFTPIALFWY